MMIKMLPLKMIPVPIRNHLSLKILRMYSIEEPQMVMQATNGEIDDYDYASDDNRFENEYNIFDRVAYFNGNTFADADLRDPRQRFTQSTKIVANEMINNNVINLKKQDVHYILKQIQYIPNVKYNNPTTFVLGLWVTKSDGTINKEYVKKIIPQLPSLTYPVKNCDVIRYANLWIATGLYRRNL